MRGFFGAGAPAVQSTDGCRDGGSSANSGAKPRLLYILAPSFSGSTLLTYLLAQHPEIATIGELKASIRDVRRYRCSCGEPIVQCGFWRQVQDACRREGMEFSVERFDTALEGRSWLGNRLICSTPRGPMFELLRLTLMRCVPSARQDLEQKLRRNYAISEVIRAIQGGALFLDGSKNAMRLLHFIRSGLWDLRVVYLHRDGRGVINSMMKHFGLGVERAGAEWAHMVRQLEHMRNRLRPPMVRDLKYEDLCSRPKESLQETFSWLGLESIPVATDGFKQGDFHILGNNMRLDALSEIRLDERWRTELSAGEQHYFMEKFGRVNRRLGYG